MKFQSTFFNFRNPFSYFILGLFLLCGVTAANATVRYVKPVTNGTGDGSSWANASANLQAMINASAANDEVWVAAGTYKPTTDTDRNISFSMKNGVAIYGGFNGTETQLSQRNWNSNVTILSGEIGAAGIADNSYRVINNTFTAGAPLGSSAVLDGFTVEAGNANGTFPLNLGGGMWNTHASPTVRNCIFRNNTSAAGGAMFNDNSQAGVTNCLFLGNSCTANGAAIANGAGTASIQFTNCTFYGNTGSITIDNETNSSFTNCIIWGNDGGVAGGTVTYSIIQGGYSGTGNLNADPLFVNAASGDFRLQACSPALDAGSNTGAPSTDLDGNARPFNATGLNRVDMGAYESQTALPGVPQPFGDNVWNVYAWKSGGTNIPNPNAWSTGYAGYYVDNNLDINNEAYWPVVGSPSSASGYQGCPVGNDNFSYSYKRKGFPPGDYQLNVENHDDAAQLWINGTMVWEHNGCCDAHVNVWSGTLGTNDEVEFRVTEGVGGSLGKLNLILCFPGNVVYVNANATGANNGTSWADAFIDLQTALSHLCNNVTEIWVAAGTYKPTTGTDPNAAFSMKPNVAIYGGLAGNEPLGYDMSLRNFVANESILSGDIGTVGDNSDNSYHVIYNNKNGLTSTAILDGFTITGGNAGFTSFTNVFGGGMFNFSSSPSVRNCTFSENHGSPLTGSFGGAFSDADASTTLTNCIFIGNSATRGGGACEGNGSGTTTFVDCIFKNNVCHDGATIGTGGAYQAEASHKATFINCIFDGNKALGTADDGGGAIMIYNGNVTIVNSTIVNSTSVTGGGAISLGLGTSSLDIKNSILWNNTQATGDEILNLSTGVATATYCLFQEAACPLGVTCGDGMIFDTDPLFVNAADGDFRLQACSPAFDAGTNTGAPSTDLDGIARPFNATGLNRVDMGAYESQTALPGVPQPFGDNVWNVYAWKSGGTNIPNPNAWSTGYAGYYVDNNLDINTELRWPVTGSPSQASGYQGCTVGNDNHSYSYKRKGFPVGNYQLNVDGHDDAAQLWINGNKVWEHNGCCDAHVNVWTGNLGANDEVEFRVTEGTSGSLGRLNFIQCPSGNVVYVNANASGANNGTSWADAFTDLQSALTGGLCSSVTEIWVAAGIYKPTTGTDRNISFVMINDLAIYGGFNGTETLLSERNWVANATILSGDIGSVSVNTDNSYHVIYNNVNGLNNSAVLDGFTISDGNAQGNVEYYTDAGGGIFNANVAPTIRNCIIKNNAAVKGGGAFQRDGAFPKFINCLFYGNSSIQGGAIYNVFNGSPILTNCTIAYNTASYGGTMANWSGSMPTVTNSILWGNPPSEIANSGSSATNVTYSIVQGSYPGTGNLSADPLFVSAANGDFHLQACSPALDAGTNTGAPATDLDGNARPFNATGLNRVDMGAYESQTALPGVPQPFGNNVWNVFAWKSGGASIPNANAWSAGYAGYYVDSNLDINTEAFWPLTGSPSSASGYQGCPVGNDNFSFSCKRKGFPAGSYQLNVDYHDDSAELWINGTKVWEHNGCCDVHVNAWSGSLGANDEVEFRVTEGTNNGGGKLDLIQCYPGNIVYVNANATGANNGSSWTDAFTDLQTALNSLCSNVTEIWVAAGTYKPTTGTDRSLFFSMRNNLAIYGGFNGTETMLSERNWTANVTTLSGDIGTVGDSNDNSYRVVRNSNLNNSAVLDGFTVTGAKGIVNVGFGSGVLNINASPSIINCKFINNTAFDGGGIYNSGTCTPLIYNCVFSGNTATNIGGGILNNSTPSYSITNCTFFGNSGPTGLSGGIAHYQSAPFTVSNCIIWGNSAGIYTANSSVSISNSIVQGGYSGTGNLNADPLFVNAAGGDFHLQACSPAIDAGTSTGAPTTDLDGNARVDAIPGGGIVDMGTYEYQGTPNLCLCIAVRTWTGAASSDWNTDANWSPACVPTAVNNVVIPDTDTDPIIMGGTAALANSVHVQTGAMLSIQNSASLTINGSAAHSYFTATITSGFYNQGRVENSGELVLGAVSGVGQWSLWNRAIFNNNPGGHLRIDRSGQIGLYNHQGTFTNAADITIGGVEGAGITGLSNQTIFNNNPGGHIRIDRSSNTGLANVGTFDNAAEITIGAIASVGIFGIQNNFNFTNNAGGHIHIDRSSSRGISNNSNSTFTNAGEITIGANASVGANAITNSATFNNSPCTALINIAADAVIDNFGTFTNAGRIIENASGNSSISSNTGVVQNLNGGTFTIGSGNPAITFPGPVSACCPAGNVLFVKHDASGANDGTSWADAYTDLQSALNSFCPNVTEIWVAQGTYKPTTGTDRNAAFVMKPNVAIYGGFNGTETMLSERNWVNNVTILSGNIGDTNIATDNSTHVIFNNNNGLTATARLDGFTISDGYATGASSRGAGLYNSNVSPTIANCIFTQNFAEFVGGAVYISQSSNSSFINCTFTNNRSRAGGAIFASGANSTISLTFTDCVFDSNRAEGGGAVCNGFSNIIESSVMNFSNCWFKNNLSYNDAAIGTGGAYQSQAAGCTANFTNCVMDGNQALGTADDGGGAIMIYSGIVNIVNSTIVNSTSATKGGAISLFYPTASVDIKNSILWNNTQATGDEIFNASTGPATVSYTLVQEAACPAGVTCGDGMIYNSDPLFVSLTGGDLHLQACSPAIDTATTTGAPVTDYDYNARVDARYAGLLVDMGAYEFQSDIDTDNDGVADCVDNCVDIFNPLQEDADGDQIGDACDLCTEPFITLPANGASTVACPAQATLPMPPNGTDQFGQPVAPSSGPTIQNDPSPLTCEGTKTYTWTYTDCDENTYNWSYTYTIERNDFTMPSNGSATVACPSQIVQPIPPMVADNCGLLLNPAGPVIGATPDCEGTKTYTWTYTDCEGNSHPWVFTYTIERNDFAVPANGAATVACPALAVQPTPPTVLSDCGETITPTGPVIGATPACEGTKTYTWTYTDCEGNSHPWVFTYTIERNDFTVPANGVATVACPALATQPTPPTVLSDCGETITPTGPVIGATPACEGTKTYTWTYTDCEGNSHPWVFTYTIERNDFAVPANGAATVACPALAVTPTPPVVLSDCGETITPTGPVIGTTPACEGVKTYTWTYTDCEGNSHPWVFTYTIERNDFTVPANGAATVACPALAVQPTPPTVLSDCGETITPTGPVIGATPACEGTKTYTWTYTDCEGNSHPWVFTYTIERNDFTVPANGAATVACPALATQPTPPTVLSDCGETITPTGPVIGATPACEGTKTYTWTYTDCEGNSHPWVFTYTIERNDFAVPANGAATVACPALATQPTPPTVLSDCGETITPTGPVIGATPACEGTKTYTWTYTDCEGNSHPWVFTYTIERNDFTVPANGAATVACPALATQPTPPTVLSDCGETIVPTGPVIGATPACEGTKTYTWTYTDCEGNSHPWVFTYTIEREQFTIGTPNGSATVACPALATQPTPPTVTSNCGEVLTPTGPVITNNPNPLTCEGTRIYTWTYTDCEGNTASWNFTYTIERNPFTVPANGSATVACPALATQPTPPTVLSNCGEVLTPTGPVITNNPNPLTCEGTRTYAWTYTDCEGNTATWSFVYTIERLPFGVPTNGGATVSCPDQTDVQPTPPVVTSNCGEVLTPVVTSTSKPGCEGNRNWNFTYTDCEGNTATWTFIYTVEYQDFSLPPSEEFFVECPLNIELPTPPVVYDNCGKLLNPAGPNITHLTGPTGCEAGRKFEWTYKDCEGNAHVWSVTYYFEYNADFFVYPDQVDYVACLDYAQPPVPPTIYGICGEEIQVTGPVVTEEISEEGCSGVRTFTYTYTDCGGHSHDWSLTYFANDNEPPTGFCPSGTVFNVDETGLSCIQEVPCPESFDFTQKIHELLAAGHIQDLCSGDDLVVTLDSWSALWDCSDPDGDGQYTFGRTFYFSIADQCGNEMPELCSVTYSGNCQPITAFSQADWGLENETSNIDPLVIQHLLDNYGPLTVGGIHRSLTLTDGQCLASLLPGQGTPTVLSDCHQTNCTGCNVVGPLGMKNTLAANTIALMMSMRYSMAFNGATMQGMQSLSLGCLTLNPSLYACPNGGGCYLHLYSSNGQEYQYPYTLGGLLTMVNAYLDGGIPMTAGQSGAYATALSSALDAVTGQYSGAAPPVACGTGPGLQSAPVTNKSLPTAGPKVGGTVSLSLVPNPTRGRVNVKLTGLTEAQEVRVEIRNMLGQLMLSKDLGQTQIVDEQMDLNRLGGGMYIVSVKAGGERFEQKLVISGE